jgi:hypothetical protein
VNRERTAGPEGSMSDRQRSHTPLETITGRPRMEVSIKSLKDIPEVTQPQTGGRP